jgi:hypothetical protein
MPASRRLAAILAADVAGYSRLMGRIRQPDRFGEIDERSERIQGAYGVNCKLVRSYKPAPS